MMRRILVAALLTIVVVQPLSAQTEEVRNGSDVATEVQKLQKERIEVLRMALQYTFQSYRQGRAAYLNVRDQQQPVRDIE